MIRRWRMWDTRTGDLLKTFKGHTELVHALAFSPNGDTLASASHDNTLRLWDAETGHEKKVFHGAYRLGVSMQSSRRTGSGLQVSQLGTIKFICGIGIQDTCCVHSLGTQGQLLR